MTALSRVSFPDGFQMHLNLEGEDLDFMSLNVTSEEQLFSQLFLHLFPGTN